MFAEYFPISTLSFICYFARKLFSWFNWKKHDGREPENQIFPFLLHTEQLPPLQIEIVSRRIIQIAHQVRVVFARKNKFGVLFFKTAIMIRRLANFNGKKRQNLPDDVALDRDARKIETCFERALLRRFPEFSPT